MDKFEKQKAEQEADEAAAKEAAEKDGTLAAVPEKGGSEEKNPIDEAKDVLTKITEQNKIMQENLKKAERVAAEMMLSGRTRAGQPERTDEEQAEADARALIAGSGFEDRAFPPK